jgi:putative NADPH-quinone reductase
MNEVKRVIIVNGSPKTTDVSVSGMLCSLLEKRFEPEHAHIIRINVRKNIDRDNTEDFSSMMNADAVVFVFPLYFFCLPGLVIRYLQDFYEFFGQHKKESDGIIKIYAVVNCGFPESDINSEALRVVKSFSMHINASFRFGISIGGGGMFMGARTLRL